jgi:hypothetical protein
MEVMGHYIVRAHGRERSSMEKQSKLDVESDVNAKLLLEGKVESHTHKRSS